jgi:hypothetical protein
MAITLPKPIYSIGAGYLLGAPIGTSEPTSTVSGGVFTDSWPVGWFLFGATDTGNVFNYQVNVEAVDSAEFFDPLAYETESRAGRLEAALISIVASNMAYALNGGTKTTTGSGATLKTVVKPPAAGAETRLMLGWESRDSKERYVIRQAFQGGEIGVNRGKGAGNKTKIPTTWNFEMPDTGLDPFDHIFAGTRAV